MNAYLLCAALLTFCIGVAHSWLGEVKLIGPLTAPETRSGMLAQSGLARNVLRFAWHITTIAWWGLAAVLVLLAQQPLAGAGKAAILAIALTFFFTGLACLPGGRRHWAWAVFLLIAALTGVSAT